MIAFAPSPASHSEAPSFPPFGDGSSAPSSPRAGDGRFARGNRGGPGNPYAAAVGRLRSALVQAVTDDDIRDIARMLVGKARAGDIAAAREVLGRLLGPPVHADLIARIESLEAHSEARATGRIGEP